MVNIKNLPLKVGDIVFSGQTPLPSIILITDVKPEIDYGQPFVEVRIDYEQDRRHNTQILFSCCFELMEAYDLDPMIFPDLDVAEQFCDEIKQILNDWGDFEQIDEDTFLIKYPE